MKAHGRKLILKVEPIKDKIGSIIMPETSVKKLVKTREGVVISLGDDASFDYEAKVGDRVMFDRAGELFEENGEVLLNKSAILYVYQ